MKIKLWMGGAALFQLAAALQVPVKADPAKPVARVAKPASDAKPAPPVVVLPFETIENRRPKLVTHGDVFIKDGRILTATHGTIEKGSILVRGGKIVAMGNITAPAGVPVIDARGKVVSPGIVDAHVHRGIDTTNEGSDAIVGEVRILDVLNPDSKTLWQAVASGETSGLILHGSANPVGGQSLVAKFKFGRPVDELPVPDAPRMIKFALGENVTRSGQQASTRFPHTRMGVEAVYRRAFTEARQYNKKWDDYERAHAKDASVKAPQRDLRLETLGDILKRKIWVQCHSYRSDEILMMVRLSQEFGFKIGAMQHALESYKLAPELAKAGVGVSVFADDWAAKLELYDMIPYTPSIITQAGGLVSINTDGVAGTTAINLDAAKSMRYGGLTEQQTLDLVTINPAKELGIDKRTGSLEIGKDADIVIWDGHPLSSYSRVETTLIDGEVFFQRRDAFNVDNSSIVKNILDPVHYVASPTAPPKSRTYAILHANIYPVSSPMIQGGTVVIQDGKIKAVGKNVDVPVGALKIEAKGLNVYPGFIDAGTTLGLTEFGQVGQATDAREMGTFEPDLVALTAVEVQSEHLPVSRCAGVTSAFTAPRGGSVAGQGSVMNMQGWTTELLGIKPKAALCVTWSGSPRAFDDSQGVAVDDDGDAKDQDMGGGGQGFGGGGGGATPGDLKSYFDKAIKYGRHHDSVDLSMEAMQPYISGQLPVQFRVSNAAGIAEAVAFIKKYKLKGVLVGAGEAWKQAKLLADSKIPVIISVAGASTLDANTVPSDWDPYDTPYATAALLKRAGVKFCFQTDGYADVKDLPQRAAESCAYGLDRNDMIRAITLSSAEILGVENLIGSLEPGKLGNLIVCDGDPCEMTGSIRYEFINGQPVQLTSKFTRLRDQYLQRLK